MKKLLIAIAAITITATSQAQLGALLKKKDKGAASATSSDVKEQLIADEPGTIYGNYYFKYIYNPASTNEYYTKVFPSQLPPSGQTMQISRYKEGVSDAALIGWGGYAHQVYDGGCKGCMLANAGGGVYFEPFSLNGEPQDKPIVPLSFKKIDALKGELLKLKDDVLAIPSTGETILLLSKEKAKLDAFTNDKTEQVYTDVIKARNAAIDNGDKGRPMFKPGGSSYKLPLFAKARAAAPAALKKWLNSEKGVTHLEPLYAYEMTEGVAFSTIRDNIGKEIGRFTQFYVVCKNNNIATANKDYKNEFKTKYVTFVVTIAENGSNGSFDGKYFCKHASNGYPINDAENIMQYK